jgi:pectinesterase
MPSRSLASLSLVLLAPLAFAAPEPPKLHLAGDSTMADKDGKTPEYGWGQALPRFFKDPTMVRNYAANGRSTLSFITEGRWQKLIDAVQPGDFVIIQFGHNDEKIDKPGVGTDVQTAFPDNLRRFIREVRAKHATPILATSVARRKFDATGKLYPTHGAYPDATRAVAREENVPLLELEHATEAWLRGLGDEPSKLFFNKLPNGAQDDTHFVEAGAVHVAELAVAQLRELKLPLAAWLK